MKKIIYFYLMLSVFQIFTGQSHLPYPYNTLKEILPFNNHGFYLNAVWLEKLIKNNSIQNAVEVGSWLGHSTRHIASLMPDDSKLYAVDTWLGSVEHHEHELWAQFLPTLYEQFLSNVIHAGLTHKIVPVRMSSQDAVDVLKHYHDSFDLIYIDAAHDTQSVYQDLKSYFPLIQEGSGILCGDDWMHEPIRIAVLAFAVQHNLTVYADENFWFFAQDGSFQIKSFKNASLSIWQFSKTVHQ